MHRIDPLGSPPNGRGGSAASGQRRSGRSTGLTAAVLLMGMLAIGSGGPTVAIAQTSASLQEVSWFHGNPNAVLRFVLYVSPTQGSIAQARQIDVGRPRGESANGGRVYSAMVEMSADEFVAVAAVGSNGLQSSLSDWARPQPSAPGQPLPAEP